MHDIEYALERHTIVRRNTSLRSALRVHFSDLTNVVFGQLGFPLSFAFWATMALFLHLVGHIGLRIAEKYMERVAAKRDITPMADVSTFWNRSFEKAPRSAVRPVVVLWPHVEFPVSTLRVGRRHPDPATGFRDHFDVLHKALKYVHSFLRVSESYFITDTEKT
jgi:hypothetical protein